MSSIRGLRIGARAAAALLLVAAASAQAAKAPTYQPVTTGASYDRNPVIVRDGGDTLLFFARSETPCDRLAGCDPDNAARYDIYVQTGKGSKWSAPALVAANPDPVNFRGRTIAATIRKDGTIDIFWASGGDTQPLYHLSRPAKSKTYTAPTTVGSAFNVETVARGNDVFVYDEDGSGGLEAYRWSNGVLTDPTPVTSGESIPKAIVDKKGTVRMSVTDGSTVSVSSSSDGLHFAPFTPVASNANGAWDPTVAQLDNGDYAVVYAPNVDPAGTSQQIAATVSKDFVHWSAPVALTNPDGWWDYWPEANVQGSLAGLYYTSEAPIDGGTAGTGHIWRLFVK